MVHNEMYMIVIFDEVIFTLRICNKTNFRMYRLDKCNNKCE